MSVCVDAGVYDKSILTKYSDQEWQQLDSFIDHDRCYGFTYAGLRQIVDKYLVQDRSTGRLYETPQYMYIMVAATLFQDYPPQTRLDYVQRYYTATSKGKINLPTPVLAGVRTPMRQFASCVLVDVDDTLDGIFSSDMAVVATSHNALASVSTQAESVASTLKSEAERYNTQALSPSLKSLKQLYDAAHKTASEVVLLQFTFLSGTKK